MFKRSGPDDFHHGICRSCALLVLCLFYKSSSPAILHFDGQPLSGHYAIVHLPQTVVVNLHAPWAQYKVYWYHIMIEVYELLNLAAALIVTTLLMHVKPP